MFFEWIIILANWVAFVAFVDSGAASATKKFIWDAVSSVQFWMAAATIVIAGAAVVNLFIYRRSTRVNIAMQFLSAQNFRMSMVAKEFDLIRKRIEMGDKKDEIKEAIEHVQERCVKDVKLLAGMVQKLGGKKLFGEMTDVLRKMTE